MSEEYEELDSFTESIIRRTQERQKLLSDETSDVLSELSSNHSQSSLKSDVLVNDNKYNIILNESQNESIVDSTSKQLMKNLAKLSPNQKRVPLNQRLNSIARTYNWDDTENIDFIDDSDTNEDIRPKNQLSKSPTKSMRQTPNTPLESPPKKRLLLNERLNQIARSYDSSDDYKSNVDDFNESKETQSTTQTNSKTERVVTGFESPTKKFTLKRNVETDDRRKEHKVEVKTPITRSPVKMQVNREEKTGFESFSPNKKTAVNVSPVKKQIESNDMKEKLSQFGFQKTEPSVRPISIYNTSDNKKEIPVINSSTNVSAVRKQFEQNCKTETKVERPEILPLRAKTDLFEKAILAENEAKSKQYHRKRRSVEFKPVVKSDNNPMLTNRVVVSNATTSDETAIKRQKSNENIQTKTNVSNNILLRRQELEAKLFGSETTTANAYKKELEVRQNEIELLKRPLNRKDSEKQNNISQEVEEEFEIEVEEKEEQNESYQSVDYETAHQTVCEAFEDIENYSNERSDEESINESMNSGFESYKSDLKLMTNNELNIESKSPTKNRLYPELFSEPNEICAQNFQSEINGPEKPPRLYQPKTETNTTPLRTISFYRREKTEQQKNDNTMPSKHNIVFKTNVNQTLDNIDLAERNRKIQERIDELKDKVEETNRIAGQASQALNLCLETDEFKCSTERVEAEKVLLLSGQKRIAFLNEIQKLKNKLNDKKPEPDASKGLLALSDFKLQVKGEFIVARAKGNVSEIHHLICLVNNGANVMPTNLLNSDKDIKNGFFEFDFGFRELTELSNDFQMVVHIYDLITIKHQMPHEIKYHIKRTPKKNKSTMKSPTVRSPGGPNAVMSTSFRLVGAVTINLRNYDKNCFRLENFDFNCPLEGTLKVKTELTVRHPFHKEGFFDVRDDSGFWNMRWTVLKGSRLAFWRFPEDVHKKQALAVIDMKNCINPKISLIPSHLRHICMRRNTIAMIIVDGINNSQNIFSKGGSLPRSRPFKLLISGENKENCMEWSEYMTTALSNIRLWDVDAIKPYSEVEYEKLLLSLQ